MGNQPGTSWEPTVGNGKNPEGIPGVGVPCANNRRVRYIRLSLPWKAKYSTLIRMSRYVCEISYFVRRLEIVVLLANHLMCLTSFLDIASSWHLLVTHFTCVHLIKGSYLI
jgi:hypothetical protein